VLVVTLFLLPGIQVTRADLSAVAERAKKATSVPFDAARQLLKRIFSHSPSPQETAAERLNHVAHITMNPPKQVLYQQQQLPFNSIATDYT
jgi:hypothetical protein